MKIFLFLLVVLIPIINIITGYILIFIPPKAINKIYGYRTKRSMENIALWNYAQKHSGKALVIINDIGLFVSAIIYVVLVFVLKRDYYLILSLILMFLNILTYILVYVLTETALKKHKKNLLKEKENHDEFKR